MAELPELPELPNGPAVESKRLKPAGARFLPVLRSPRRAPGRVSPAIPVAAILVTASLLGVVAWTHGWLWVDPPRPPALASESNGRIVNTRPQFSGHVARGLTRVEFAIMPPVELRWITKVNPTTGEFQTAPPVALPRGTYALSINGKPVRSFQVGAGGTAATPGAATPAASGVTGARPSIRGHLKPGLAQAEIALQPPVTLRWSVPVDPATGTYTAKSPTRLPPGVYTYYINDLRQSRFTVAKDAK